MPVQSKVIGNGVNGSPEISGHEIVVSGMSGSFPECDSLKELGEKIIAKTDLITENLQRRWVGKHPDIPERGGKLRDISRFDHEFFDIEPYKVKAMDPTPRILLEKTFEALFDAGINPKELAHTNTGVFVGSCILDTETNIIYDKPVASGFGVKGCSRGLIASRISNYLQVTGPSYTVDTACSSSMYALEHAYFCIKTGKCDMAIVGTGCLCIHPKITLQFYKLGVLSPEGKCKCFDSQANGYVRSEAISVCIIQKSKDARRIYCQMVYAKTNCDGYKEYGITFPSAEQQKVVMKEVYDESGIPPEMVEYIEAHATGTHVGDPVEMEAINEVLCCNRDKPLMVGSIKGNLGHTEPASGLCSLAKMVFAYNTGLIPPNINLKKLREDCKPLIDGKVKVVTEVTPWNRGYSAINSFGFGGANAHLLLRNIAPIKKLDTKPTINLPYLVTASGRNKLGVTRVLEDVSSKQINVYQISLLHHFHRFNIKHHDYRGFKLLGEDVRGKTICLGSDIDVYYDTPRPIWILFNGIGVQWSGIGAQLMQIPAFSEALESCHNALSEHGIDVKSIVIKPTNKTYSNLMDYIIGLIAIQISIYHVVKKVSIEPDNFVGHGLSEIVCAYASGCLTLEQAMNVTYVIGKALKNTKTIDAGWADINLPADQVASICPKDIHVIHDNGPKHCTVAGPQKDISDFVVKMQSAGILAKQNTNFDVALHSPHVQELEKQLMLELHKIIKHPKRRGNKWITTSVPDNENRKADLASPEYFIDCLMTPVMFRQSFKKLDYNTILISPLSQGTINFCIKSMLRIHACHVQLTRENHPNNVQALLCAVGRLYVEGVNMELMNLYPEVPFPVPVDTPMMSHLVEWNHKYKWHVPMTSANEITKDDCGEIHIHLDEISHEYIVGHVIDGRLLFPATGYLILVWQVYADMSGVDYIDKSIVFEDIRFMRATTINKDTVVKFEVRITKSTGYFEIIESEVQVVTGRIRDLKHKEMKKFTHQQIEMKELQLNTKDFYKELRLRGYKYSGKFQGVVGCNLNGTKAKVLFHDNWVTFLDALMQIRIVQKDTRGLFVPTRLDELTIDTEQHYKSIGDKNEVDIFYDSYMDAIRTRGISMKGLDATGIARRPPTGIPVLEKNVFVPYQPKEIMQANDITRAYIQIILESVALYKIKVLELFDEHAITMKKSPISPLIREAIEDLPLMQPELTVLSKEKMDLGTGIDVYVKNVSDETNILLFVGVELLKRSLILNKGFNTHGGKQGFILSRETEDPTSSNHPDIDIISTIFDGNEYFVLLRKFLPPVNPKIIEITSNDNKFDWIDDLKNELKESKRIVLVGQNDKYNGVLGLFNCLKMEQTTCLMSVFLMMDQNMPAFDIMNPFYKKQLDKLLPVNVFKNGQWGSYRHLKLTPVERIETDAAFVNVLCRGDLSSLSWIEAMPAAPKLCERGSKSLVQIYYAALNFRDIMTASGKLAVEAIVKGRMEQECVQGLEFSGRTESGERIMGLTSKGALANTILAENDICWKVPDEWTLEEAATVPVVYSTVLYAFRISGGLKPGCSILIHAGSGGIGQAAINICSAYGCNIFTTVGTQEKKEFIMKTFPSIPESHIGNSRDTSFEDMIMVETSGTGVDVVLNSLADEKLQASLRCVGTGGKFLEIGKFDMANNSLLGYSYFDRQRSFKSVMLDRLIDSTPQEKRELRDQVYDAMKKGIIKPLTRTVFGSDEVQIAFRHMAHGKHIGKVLVKIRDEEEVKIVKPQSIKMMALPRYLCSEDGVFVITGGLGGFGLELADRLVLRGAKKMVLASRKGISNGYQLSRVRTWESYGIKVHISTDDITKQDGCLQLLKHANSLGDVHAIFNLAVVLEDCLFENQTVDTFRKSFGAKALATKYLDMLSRRVCPKLKNFVVFSSVSCGRGNAGQTNYGMANSVMERICECRRDNGLHALAIQWGAVGDVGLVADMQEEHIELEIGGTLQQSIINCLDSMELLLRENEAIVSSMVVAEKKISSGSGNLIDKIAAIIGVKDIKSISATTPLSELGLDSMTGVEIKQTLERDFEIFLSAREIRNLTFGRLMELAETAEGQGDQISQEALAQEELELLLRNISLQEGNDEPVITPETTLTPEQAEKAPIMFFLPGIDGTSHSLVDLCSRVNGRVKILQLGVTKVESIKDNARRLAELALAELKENEKFIVVGYSYGSIIGLEITSYLESKGYKGLLICIDGSPRNLKNMLDKIGMPNADSFENLLITYFSIYLVTMDREEFQDVLKNAVTWEEKLDLLYNYRNESVVTNKDYFAGIITAVNQRMKNVNEMDVNNDFKKLDSQIKLIRTEKHNIGEMSVNYDLMIYTDNKIDVYYIDGNHRTILDSANTSVYINNIIDEFLNGDSELM